VFERKLTQTQVFGQVLVDILFDKKNDEFCQVKIKKPEHCLQD